MELEKRNDGFNTLQSNDETLNERFDDQSTQSPRQYQKQQINQILRIEGENRAIIFNDGSNDRALLGFQEVATGDDT